LWADVIGVLHALFVLFVRRRAGADCGRLGARLGVDSGPSVPRPL